MMLFVDTPSFLLLELALAWKDHGSDPVDCYPCWKILLHWEASFLWYFQPKRVRKDGKGLSYRIMGVCGGSSRSQGVRKAQGFQMPTPTSNLITIPWASEKIYLCWQLKNWFMKAEAIKSI